MEYNYGTRFNIRDYITGAGLSADVAVIVAADDVPHYCVVPFVQYPCLVGTYAGIRWAEQIGFYHVTGNVYIPYIVTCVHTPSLYMAV